MINPIFAFGMPGGYEWIIILGIVILLFGGAKLPELAKGLGKAINEFKKAKDVDDSGAKSDKKNDEDKK
ncbi:MAG: twin-arginine translocase TatA/TatE family subunit [Verrucomicrobiota bacterium]|nr:twin-arginine translocase TatA/TatE family subunit [Verrucomicrobiota bacterium]